MKIFVSPHAHGESLLTGSTIANMVDHAKSLGRTHFAYTDHGHLSSVLAAYELAKGKGLKFIPGIEIYFKDSKCPIITNTSADRAKYFTLTLYSENQAAYQELSKTVSRTDFPTIEINEELQALWSWDNLIEISKFDISIVLGGIHCMVGKVMLSGQPKLAQEVFAKLKSIFGEKMFVSLVCEPWSKKWTNIIQIDYKDGSHDSLLATDQISTDKARRIRAGDLIERSGHTLIKSKSANLTTYEVNKAIKEVTLHKGFLPLPGGDVTLKINRFLKALAKRDGIPILATDYAYYAHKEDKIVQTMRLEGNNKLHPNLHMKSSDEILSYLKDKMGITDSESEEILASNNSWASRFDKFEFKYEWRLATVDGNPLKLAMDIIKQNGRMKWDNPTWVDRLKEEIEVIAKNPKKDLTPYFLPIRDVLNHYKENGLLIGPGRGSAGGSLFVYLLGITEIDPFKYDLPFNRFFSMDRIMGSELPDIDVDLESRELLVGEDGKSGYLYGRWGDKAAQIGTKTTIRLKSAIKDTNRYFMGKVEAPIEVFSKGLPTTPQGVTDLDFVFGYEDKEENHIEGLIDQSEDLKKYSRERPKEWEIVTKAMGLTRAFSRHASAFVLSDLPIKDTVPTRDGNITQYDAKRAEKAGLIKYDFLVINQLKDIRVCLDLINKRNGDTFPVGYFKYKDNKTFIWDLPEEKEVFQSVWTGATETIFQINTKSMIPFVIDIMPEKIMDLANILALVRPGPMDFIDPATGRNMVEEYVLRRRGEGQSDIKELETLLPETYGIITFQEQLNKIARQLAGFSGPEAEKLRKHMAKKNKTALMAMKPAFIEGAIKKTSQETAEGIWERMETFGRYGFSVIHAVEYAHITHACMFLKHHYPLEWWTAILSNADEGEITGSLWPYVRHLIDAPDINLSTDVMVPDYANNKIRAKFGVIKGIGDKSIDPIVEGRPYKNIEDFVNKKVAAPSLSRKLIHVGVLDSLFPPKIGLQNKLQIFEDILEARKFNEKKEEAELKGKTLKAKEPKKGKIPKEYVDIPPMKDAAIRKSILPSLTLSMYHLGMEHSKVKVEKQYPPKVKLPTHRYPTLLVRGDKLRELDELEAINSHEDVYVAATCYVISTEEFSFPKAKPTKRALKMVLDVDGYVSEKVLWPDYNTEQLEYPENFKRGCIATIFFKKRAGKKDMSIMNFIIET